VTSAIIVAAGKSTRMGPHTDKLFLPVAGRPLLAHAWQRFDSAPFIGEIVLVVRDGCKARLRNSPPKFRFTKPFRLVAGGRQRQDSVWNGLEALSPPLKSWPSRMPPGPAPAWP
jgi:2-C-methyl-D-erythritol 4-phosphate cytidylyltransferase